MKIFDAWPLIRFPILAEYFLCMLQKLLLPLCNLARMNLVMLGKFNDHLVALPGIQRHLGLERRCMIPSWSFAHMLILLGFIIEQLSHLCPCPEGFARPALVHNVYGIFFNSFSHNIRIVFCKQFKGGKRSSTVGGNSDSYFNTWIPH